MLKKDLYSLKNSNKRLKHWEGSQTKLAYIKRELKRDKRSALELKEQALA